MDANFSNTEAAVCGVIAIAQVIFFFVYAIVTNIQLKRKTISMGRLIPTVPVAAAGGSIPSNIVQSGPYSNNYPNNYNNYTPIPQVGTEPSAPPPGFVQSCDNPPPYSTVTSQPSPTSQK